MSTENITDAELYKLCLDIYSKTVETLGNDKKRPLSQVKQIVFDLLYDKVKDMYQSFSEDDLNEFIYLFNAIKTYMDKSYEGSETEKKSYSEKIDLFEITSLDGETLYKDEDDKIVTHIIYDGIASIIFFYLAYTVNEKQITIADLGRYLPDNRGLDTNYEFANGLIVREVLLFWENNQQFHNWHKLKAYLPFSSKLETMIFKNKYHDISFIDEKKPPKNLDAVIINVPYISIPYQYKNPIDLTVESVGRIDIFRFEEMLKEALNSLSANGSLFLVFRMLDVFSHEDSGIYHHLHLGVADESKLITFPESPSFIEWTQLYNVFSKYNLTIDSIIKTNDTPNFEAPSFYFANDYLDSSGVIILRKKGTVNKTVYSVISLRESSYSIQQLRNVLKTVVCGSMFTEKGLEAEFFNKEIEFNGYINDTKNREIFLKKKNLQLAQGFRELSGKDIIKKINTFDVNSNIGFEENDNSIFIPLDGNLLFLTYFTHSIDEFEEELVNKKVKYKHLNWSNVPWHSFILKVLDNPATPESKKEIIKTALQNFNMCYWEKYNFFDITQFGFEIRDNAIFYEDSLIQELLYIDENEKDYYKANKPEEWALKKQIMCSNVFEVVLDPKVVSTAYLKLLLDTRAGEMYFRDLAYKCPEVSRIAMFLNTKLVIPSIELQTKLIEHSNYIETQKQQIEVQKETFYDYIGGGVTANCDEAFKLIDKYDYGSSGKSKFLLDALPQPIASILYLDDCEENTARKNINYFHLFEAIAHFHATVLLSIIQKKPDCENDFDKVINNNILKEFTPSTRKRDIRADFGLWTTILIFIAENCTNHISFDVQCNDKLLRLLKKANEERNKKMAHAPRWSEVKEKELNGNLANLANDIL